ncbi:MAG: PHP domain-containing protein [Ruminococcaceae bacterium]|nr:PHP domain-containing protein [Oscillospiraceae bacterium]
MAKNHLRFCVFPAVVKAGEKNRISIYPCDISRRFMPDNEYEVGIIGLLDDMESYLDKLPRDLKYEIKDGTLQLEFEFPREQEYEISFGKKGEKPNVLSVYALEEDLFCRRPLKGDFHTHSYYSDGNDGVASVPANYREQGFDFFALTDHNRMYTSDFAKECYKDVKLGMHIINGEEVHTPGSLLHLVSIGANKSVCNRYVKDPEAYENEVSEIEKTLSDIPESYRRRIAMAHWACNEIHSAGGIAILAHPFWKPYKYNLSDEFCDLLFKQGIFDAFELMGGISTLSCNLQLALWQKQCDLGHKLSVVGSSDSHNHNFGVDHFGRKFSFVFAKGNDTKSILDAVKNGYSVAAELPVGNEEDVRFYGDFRLVAFSHFLFKNYFDKTFLLCQTEGALMQRYAAGEELGAVLDALAPSVEEFYKRFYGITSAPALSQRSTEYTDRLLEAQLDSGIVTKGSSLVLRPNNMRNQ